MYGTFAALDVETANPDLASICQVGVVTFTDGQVTGSWQSLVDPEDDFDPVNVSIHGIDADMVAGAPRFADLISDLEPLLDHAVLATHTAFDRVALSKARTKYGLDPVTCEWLDTARVCRRAWPRFARRGYGLRPVAQHFGIGFKHHDALEDARAAGEILLRAILDTGLGITDWIARVKQPLVPGATTRSGNGHERSTKHRKAESLIRSGQPIRILCERDFLALVHLD